MTNHLIGMLKNPLHILKFLIVFTVFVSAVSLSMEPKSTAKSEQDDNHSKQLIVALQNTTPKSPESDPSLCEAINAKFIVERCKVIGDVSCPPVGECTSECMEFERYFLADIPRYEIGGHIVGIVSPDGDETIWTRNNWQYLWRVWDNDGQSYIMRYKPKEERVERVIVNAASPIAISIGERENIIVEARSQTDGAKSKTPVSSDQKDTPKLLPIPYLTLNGDPLLKHLFFVNDEGGIELIIKNNAPQKESRPSNDPCLPAVPPGGPMVVQITVSSPTSFLKNIETQSFTLAPQTERKIQGKLFPYLDKIKTYEKDILFGAHVAIRIWPEADPSTILMSDSFNIYRYLDVADDNHRDGIAGMARTLADGPGKVQRKRALQLNVHDQAAIELGSIADSEFDISKNGNNYQIVFDPKKDPTRQVKKARWDIKVKEDSKLAGSVKVWGYAVPPQKIHFNEIAFIKSMSDIVRLSQIAHNSQPDAVAIQVHPALIPQVESKEFDTKPKIIKLAVAVKMRMEKLYGGLRNGIKWVNTVDRETVNLNWALRVNERDPETEGGPFVMGKAFESKKDKNQIDNWESLKKLVPALTKYNDAEAGYRLSKAINPNFGKQVYLYPDSMLENHKSYGANTISLGSVTDIANAFAKTAVHEISHTMSLKHPIQVGTRVSKTDELQKLTIDNKSVGSFTLSFHGAQTEAIEFHGADRRAQEGTAANQRVGVRIYAALRALKTIGYENYIWKQPEGEMKAGLQLWRCTAVPKDNEKLIRIVEACGDVTDDRVFIVRFIAHLGGINVDPLQIIPSTADNKVESFQDGTMTRPIKVNKTGVLALVDIPGVSKATIESDIMYGGYNDVEGSLAFQPGVSLEAMKMAMAMNYTEADVKKVIALYNALIEKNAQFGDGGF